MNVFLSHSTKDAPFALKLAERLRTEGFEPWLCEVSIEPAANWVEEIEKSLAKADWVLLVWSPDAAESFATRLEWTSALAREISDRRLRLGVVLLRDAELPQLLRTKQYIDARANREKGIRAVLDWLKGRLDAGRLAGGRAPIYLPDYKPKGFVGRADYLERLRVALTDEPGVFLLTGEPGSGKSTLGLMFA